MFQVILQTSFCDCFCYLPSAKPAATLRWPPGRTVTYRRDLMCGKCSVFFVWVVLLEYLCFHSLCSKPATSPQRPLWQFHRVKHVWDLFIWVVFLVYFCLSSLYSKPAATMNQTRVSWGVDWLGAQCSRSFPSILRLPSLCTDNMANLSTVQCSRSLFSRWEMFLVILLVYFFFSSPCAKPAAASRWPSWNFSWVEI